MLSSSFQFLIVSEPAGFSPDFWERQPPGKELSLVACPRMLLRPVQGVVKRRFTVGDTLAMTVKSPWIPTNLPCDWQA
jgi:hypothetical protein